MSFESPAVLPAQPNAKGKVTPVEKLRGGLSKFFFTDRVLPVTPQELESAHHEHNEREVEGSSPKSELNQ